ncbi:dihydroneopterin aldolase [bacterium]|nr:dihydroneopterin aldolase [bacterium]MBU1884691.1 dihydroneopterin aldolase [bacterium]
MKVYIEDFRFSCIIGILDFERVMPQDVIVNLELEYEFQTEFINYADIAEIIKSSMQEKRFELIEDALGYLFSLLKEKYTNTSSLFIKITKPSILQDCRVSVSDYKTYL